MLETNVDDMSAEVFGYVSERLFALGALDVFTIPIFMKKNRPATLLTIIAMPDDVDELTECLLTETTTFGVRRRTMERTILERRVETVATPFGEVRVKKGIHEGRTLKTTPEYEDCRRLAQEHGVPFRVVYQAAQHLTPSPYGAVDDSPER